MKRFSLQQTFFLMTMIHFFTCYVNVLHNKQQKQDLALHTRHKGYGTKLDLQGRTCSVMSQRQLRKTMYMLNLCITYHRGRDILFSLIK